MGYIRSNEEWDQRVVSDGLLASQMCIGERLDAANQRIAELVATIERIARLHAVEDWYEEGRVIEAALAKHKETKL